MNGVPWLQHGCMQLNCGHHDERGAPFPCEAYGGVVKGAALLSTTLPKAERSTDHGGSNALGEAKQIVSERRTSSNAWCRREREGRATAAWAAT